MIALPSKWPRIVIVGLIALVVLIELVPLILKNKVSTTPQTNEIQNGIVQVVLTDRGFEPNEIKIQKGTTVEFATTRDQPFWPASNTHPVHTDLPAFDPRQEIDAHKTWSFTFNEAGTFGFHDHLRAYFVGTIYVVE